ncbi:hypothetical protein L873DRAFT_1815545 [Choiromyces venosus 120613-1]|uniref:Uncharacterized protein n=1 Tax=Choiromyces venosus 120613-1 TaxID=1336337 RepID=A0A3N4JAX3_9PEZI|nr:hypothetical protein L873DRAFT_1815545 [Choiromyces venosus 120613-1]
MPHPKFLPRSLQNPHPNPNPRPLPPPYPRPPSTPFPPFPPVPKHFPRPSCMHVLRCACCREVHEKAQQAVRLEAGKGILEQRVEELEDYIRTHEEGMGRSVESVVEGLNDVLGWKYVIKLEKPKNKKEEEVSLSGESNREKIHQREKEKEKQREKEREKQRQKERERERERKREREKARMEESWGTMCDHYH